MQLNAEQWNVRKVFCERSAKRSLLLREKDMRKDGRFLPMDTDDSRYNAWKFYR